MLLILFFLFALVTPATGHVHGTDWAQMSPDMQRWFKDQRNPVNHGLCCDEKDGEEVEEETRDGEYWVRSQKSGGQWIRVPPEYVILEPNKWGQPIAWFRYENGIPWVYCFIPGGGV